MFKDYYLKLNSNEKDYIKIGNCFIMEWVTKSLETKAHTTKAHTDKSPHIPQKCYFRNINKAY